MGCHFSQLHVLLLVFCCCATAVAQPAAPPRKNLIVNGDFEDASQTYPPVGWKIWGKGVERNNFSLDTDNPHGGRYALRVDHPAGTHAFPVTDPNHVIRGRKGMAYLISFWARTANQDQPGVFYLEAFSTIKPYQNVASPLRRPIHPSSSWRQYHFTVQEGRDFLADEAKYLLLAFRPTRGQQYQQTLWIDDVNVSAVNNSQHTRTLLDPRSLQHEPLNHRLSPGAQLLIKVDTQQRADATVTQAGGISFHRISGWGRHPYDDNGIFVLEPELVQAVAELRLPMTRFYGVADHRFDVGTAIDRIANLCDRCNIPQSWTVLELEPHTADRVLTANAWSQAVQQSVRKGHQFRHWEVCNEPYTRKATAFEDSSQYADHVKAVSEAVKSVQPDAQIGIGIYSSSQPWGTHLLQEAAGAYDFVVAHYYGSTDPYQHDLPTVALASNYQLLDHILKVNAVLKVANPDRAVYQLDTEWGLAGADLAEGQEPSMHWRQANIVGTLHRAVRLIYYAREGMLSGASGWEMFARPHRPRFAHLTRDYPDRRFMLYWLYYYFNRHCGPVNLKIAGTAPWHTVADSPTASGPVTPALVTLSEDSRKMFVVLANGAWDRSYPCRLELTRFSATRATARCLSQANQDANPLVAHESDVVSNMPVQIAESATGSTVTFTVPAHAVVFVTLE